jgi:hypothetical protein
MQHLTKAVLGYLDIFHFRRLKGRLCAQTPTHISLRKPYQAPAEIFPAEARLGWEDKPMIMNLFPKLLAQLLPITFLYKHQLVYHG